MNSRHEELKIQILTTKSINLRAVYVQIHLNVMIMSLYLRGGKLPDNSVKVNDKTKVTLVKTLGIYSFSRNLTIFLDISWGL